MVAATFVPASAIAEDGGTDDIASASSIPQIASIASTVSSDTISDMGSLLDALYQEVSRWVVGTK
jgi:hypothetical protein